ncbi:MAG: flagellar hook-basal body complex protein FliE [Opitutae bacterium]|nr:flagellar hook-basal body complex protein FliE [Opitutae bacterium]|tara:strand:+ start:5298 stop:5732 length:435 start_codon:yes stop_codon:yes gene_type:complete
MNEISSLPSLADLLNQNPNMRPSSLEDFASNNEIGANMGGGLRVAEPSVADPTVRAPGVPTVQGPAADRVTAPGFAQMFESFVKGVDHKKKVAKNEVQDLILGKSDNIHEAMVKVQEAGVSFNLMIQVRNKLVDSYKELMRMRV